MMNQNFSREEEIEGVCCPCTHQRCQEQTRLIMNNYVAGANYQSVSQKLFRSWMCEKSKTSMQRRIRDLFGVRVNIPKQDFSSDDSFIDDDSEEHYIDSDEIFEMSSESSESESFSSEDCSDESIFSFSGETASIYECGFEISMSESD